MGRQKVELKRVYFSKFVGEVCHQKVPSHSYHRDTSGGKLRKNSTLVPPEVEEVYGRVTPFLAKTGYCQVVYTDKEGRRRCTTMDKLVWNIHNPSNQAGAYARIVHRNGNKLDNRIENLFYAGRK